MITTGKINTQKRLKTLRPHIKKGAAAILAAIGVVSILTDASLAGEADNIVFPDAALKTALVSLPGVDANADGEITEGEIAALTDHLDITSLDISDITGMQFAAGLTKLNLSGNKIRDISCLTSLVSSEPHALTELDVSGNYLDLTEGGSDMEAINTLISAGCTVTYEPQTVIPAEGVTLDKTSLEMCVDDKLTLSASVSPADAADQTVFWLSDNEDAATVTDGEVTAIAAGTANITATTQDGGFTAVCAVTVKSNKLACSKYTVNAGYVMNVPKSTIVDLFKSFFSNDYGDLRVFKATGEAYDSGIIGTGMKVKLYVNGVQRDEATILVNGDTNGDGFITISDYTLTRLDILGLKPLEGNMRRSADINADGNITISDYTLTRLDILSLKNISNVLPDLPAVTDPRIRKFLDLALAQQGKPYVFGAEGPDSYDCSGFIYYCLNQSGYSVGRSTADTYSKKSQWQYVDRDELQPGDLMFYNSDDPLDGDHIGHIGIYLGNGYHIHASSDYMHIVICRVRGWYDDMLSHGRRVFY